MEMEQDMVCNHVLTNQGTGSQEQNQALMFGYNRETSLIEAAQNGSVSAFNQLVLDYQDGLFRWVSSLVLDEAVAEDITQQTFMAAYRKIRTFRGVSFRAWLFRIARNRSIDEIRSRQRHPAVSLDDDTQAESEYEFHSILSADLPSPEETVIQMEQSNLVLQMLNDLPEPYRQVLQLVDLYEINYQEAAEILELPLGTMKSRIARARAKLRDLLVRATETL